MLNICDFFYHVESGLQSVLAGLGIDLGLELRGLRMGLICVLVELDLDLEIVDFVLYVTVSGLDTSLRTV